MNETINYYKDLVKKEIKIYDTVYFKLFGLKLFSVTDTYVGKIKYDEKDKKFRFYLRFYPPMSALNQEIIKTINFLLEECGEELK